MAKYTWDYSKNSDILHIHKYGMKTMGSVEIGDFTIDFGEKSEVVGLEIEHASEFFKNLDINEDLSNDVNDVNLILDKRNPESEFIILDLQFNNYFKKISIPVVVVS